MAGKLYNCSCVNATVPGTVAFKREHPGVVMCPQALVGVRCRSLGVTDHLEVHVGLGQEGVSKQH